jgi:mevalonate kinase
MTKQREQFFLGHGKVLLSSEYFVLDGAEALALPTILGQTLTVRYRNSFEPKLIWKSYDSEGKVWFDSEFELWRFDVLSDSPKEEELLLQKILVAARELNPLFSS